MSNPKFQEIETFVKSKPVVVYMKGSPQFPQCGFSAQTIQALGACGANPENTATVDVLENMEIRNAIKEFTNWPTIPQVFIHGKFVGGCDIVTEMAERGELTKLIAGQ